MLLEDLQGLRILRCDRWELPEAIAVLQLGGTPELDEARGSVAVPVRGGEVDRQVAVMSRLQDVGLSSEQEPQGLRAAPPSRKVQRGEPPGARASVDVGASSDDKPDHLYMPRRAGEVQGSESGGIMRIDAHRGTAVGRLPQGLLCHGHVSAGSRGEQALILRVLLGPPTEPSRSLPCCRQLLRVHVRALLEARRQLAKALVKQAHLGGRRRHTRRARRSAGSALRSHRECHCRHHRCRRQHSRCPAACRSRTRDLHSQRRRCLWHSSR
mmetsp:Transcript_95165/g.306638  ORF Transcript_95165/g.306638 Transcript_95165/m.306638 type:complete len:269 (+) Transcript_95165:1237-2043(+)